MQTATPGSSLAERGGLLTGVTCELAHFHPGKRLNRSLGPFELDLLNAVEEQIEAQEGERRVDAGEVALGGWRLLAGDARSPARGTCLRPGSSCCTDRKQDQDETPSSGAVVEWAGPSALLLLEGATRFPGQENTNRIPMSPHSQGGGAGGLVRQREKIL